jgi:hypothetical protein
VSHVSDFINGINQKYSLIEFSGAGIAGSHNINIGVLCIAHGTNIILLTAELRAA